MLIDFKRIEGVTRDNILNMVRACEGTFSGEFLNAGFELVERRDDMFPENYLLKCKRRMAAKNVQGERPGSRHPFLVFASTDAASAAEARSVQNPYRR